MPLFSSRNRTRKALLSLFALSWSHPLALQAGQDTSPAPLTAPSLLPSAALLEPPPQSWLFHFQATEILQGQPGFHSPYHGTNSLRSDDHGRQTTSIDLYLGSRLWEGGELYFNPEYYQGFGLGGTHGIAAFPSGEAYKTGSSRGDGFIPHLFYRHVIGLGGEQEFLPSDSLQLAGKVDIDRLTFTGGRLMVGDQFDQNAYSHDQRRQFMNWALVDNGAFDYAADGLGAIEGFTVDLNRKSWAIRWGIFDVPKVSNANAKDTRLDRAWQQVLELETRYQAFGHPGKCRLLAFLEQAHLGNYALATPQPPPSDITLTRRYRFQQGFGINFEQELTQHLGGFLKASWRDGKSEIWQFTDIDRSLSAGVHLKGTLWNRPSDTLGIAGILSGISTSHRAYLAAGGLGPIIGDDQLPHYGSEKVIETFYDTELFRNLHAAADYQLIVHPAYNPDRGPVHLFALRLHVEY